MDASRSDDGTQRAAEVIIVDDDDALCELLEQRLADEPGLNCAGTATNPQTAKVLLARYKPDVVILDIGLGSGVDAIELIAEFVVISPASHILIWTKWTDPTAARSDEIHRKMRAIRNGASDWIPKSEGIHVMVDRIRAAVRSGPPSRIGSQRSPLEESLGELLDHVHDPAPDGPGGADGLTPAERRVVRATVGGLEVGLNIEQIAQRLKISVHTLRTQLRNVYAKWNVHSQAAFVSEAHRRRLS